MSLPSHLRAAIETYVPALEGGDWAELGRRCDVAELVIDTKPKVVVEIGTFGGAGAIPIAFALRQNNNGGKIYCIDPYRSEYAVEGEWEDNQKWWTQNVNLHEIHRKCMVAIWSHNIDEWIVVIRAASQHCWELFLSGIDILVIDGNHSEVASLRDAKLYVPRVRSGGYIVADDVDWQTRVGEEFVQSTKKAMQFIEESCDIVKQSGNMRFYKKR